MKLKKLEVTCPNCNEKFETTEILSYNTFGQKRYLDSYMATPDNQFDVHMCPHCGYVTEELNKPVTAKIKNIVKSAQYQDIFTDNTISDNAKKYGLMSLIYYDLSEYKLSALAALKAYWNTKKCNLSQEDIDDILKYTIYVFQEYLDDEVDIEASMILVDLQRKMGWYDDAEETIKELNERLDFYKSILSFETKLIEKKDTQEYTLDEVLK